jgi:hypothetical protein
VVVENLVVAEEDYLLPIDLNSSDQINAEPIYESINSLNTMLEHHLE